MLKSNIYSGFRYPPEIISHVVWRYFRFALSLRDVEEILVARGVIVTYETVQQWTLKFGQMHANLAPQASEARRQKVCVTRPGESLPTS